MEDSLLEYTNAILNLLNMATHKGSLSSSHLVQRLEYLKHRLDDFLCPQMSGFSTTPSKPDSVRQDTGVLYECGICNSPITMYNGDHNLSMDLHCQEEVHQRALSKPEDRRVSKVKDTPVPKVDDKSVPKVDDKYVSLVKEGGMYHCSLCDVYISQNEKQLKQHLKGIFHQTNFETAKVCDSPITTCNLSKIDDTPVSKVDDKPLPKIDDKHVSFVEAVGKYHCSLCNINMPKSEKNVNEHLNGILHTTNLRKTKEDAWSKIPAEWKSHKKHFVKNGNGTLHCKPCAVPVNNVSDLLGHLHSKKHTSVCVPSPTQEQSKVEDFWSTLPKEVQPHKSLFQTSQNGTLDCKVCGVTVHANKTLLVHIQGNKHKKQTNALLIANGVTNDTYCTFCGLVTISMIDHVVSRRHQEKVQGKQDVWSLIPEAYKDHRNYFVSHDGGALRCTLCDISVAQNHVQVLEHICVKKHNDIHIMRSVVAAYCTYGKM